MVNTERKVLVKETEEIKEGRHTDKPRPNRKSPDEPVSPLERRTTIYTAEQHDYA